MFVKQLNNFYFFRVSFGLGFGLVIAFSTRLEAAKNSLHVQRANSCQVAAATFFKAAASLSHVEVLRTDGTKAAIPAANALFHQGRPRLGAQVIMDAISELGLSIREIGEALTSELKNMGMSFITKEGKAFVPPVNPVPLLIPKSVFDSIAAKEAHFRNYANRVLQVMTSMKNPTPEDLSFLSHLSTEERQSIIKIIKSSPYWDEALVHSSNSDYEFLMLGGVDLAMGSMDEGRLQHFEVNEGTPSGASNQVMIMKGIQKLFPRLLERIRGLLPKDSKSYFTLLKESLMEHGLHRTGFRGLAVMIGPGPYNAAHPDRSRTSIYSGLPLVTKKDCFIDEDGFVRLRTKLPMNEQDTHYILGDTPHIGQDKYKGYIQIHAIYSAAEDAHLLNRTSDHWSQKPGIAIKSPDWVEIVEGLNQKYKNELQREGLNLLKPGAMYRVIPSTSKDGETTYELPRRSDGSLVIEYLASYDPWGDNPLGPSSKDLAESIHKKKVFVSNYLARLADDKGLLELVEKQIRGDLGDDAEKLVVLTPGSLNPKESKNEILAAPNSFVYKPTAQSGGVGVKIGPLLSRDEANAAAVDAINAPRHSRVVQRIASLLGVVSTPTKDSEETPAVMRASDLRAFVLFDPDGQASIAADGVLVRVGKKDSLSTNNSQGAEYGYALAVDDRVQKPAGDPYTLPTPKPLAFLAESQKEALRDYLTLLWRLVNTPRDKVVQNQHTHIRKTLAPRLWFLARQLDPVLGEDFAWAHDIYSEGKAKEVYEAALKTLEALGVSNPGRYTGEIQEGTSRGTRSYEGSTPKKRLSRLVEAEIEAGFKAQTLDQDPGGFFLQRALDPNGIANFFISLSVLANEGYRNYSTDQLQSFLQVSKSSLEKFEKMFGLNYAGIKSNITTMLVRGSFSEDEIRRTIPPLGSPWLRGVFAELQDASIVRSSGPSVKKALREYLEEYVVKHQPPNHRPMFGDLLRD